MGVLSYYPNVLYDELYAGWTTVQVEVQVNGGRGKNTRIEKLWLSPHTAVALDDRSLFGNLT